MTEYTTPFDDWVAEAPFRHLGIFLLVILGLTTLFVN